MLATQKGRSKPVRTSWKRWLKLMKAPGAVIGPPKRVRRDDSRGGRESDEFQSGKAGCREKECKRARGPGSKMSVLIGRTFQVSTTENPLRTRIRMERRGVKRRTFKPAR